MPTLVHITDEKNSAAILRSGIALSKWRGVKPRVHGTRPCGCSACQRGRYGSRKLQEAYEPKDKTPFAEIKAKIEETSDPDELWSLLCQLRTKRRYADPSFLERLLEIDDEYLREDLAATLACFRHKNARLILQRMSEP